MAEKNVSVTLLSPVEGLRARADIEESAASTALSAISALHTPVTSEKGVLLCKTCSSIAVEPSDYPWPCLSAEQILDAVDVDMLAQLGWVDVD